MSLTPTQAHYLKKELLAIQLENEWDSFKQAPRLAELANYPLVNYLFQSLVADFPLLKQQDRPEKAGMFWSKLQMFLDEFNKLKLDTYMPRNKSATQRRVLMAKMNKVGVIALTARIKTTQDAAYAASIVSARTAEQQDQQDDAHAELANLHLGPPADETLVTDEDDTLLDWYGQEGLDVNVVAIRAIVEKHSIRSDTTHAHFLVQSKVGDANLVTVAHRYGQFRQLRDDLQAAFPTIEVPFVPSKANDGFLPVQLQQQEHPSDSILYREKDRIQLRVFIRQIARHRLLSQSPIFKAFLTAQPTELSDKEQHQITQRLTMDDSRVAEALAFRTQVDAQQDQLNELLAVLKQQIAKPGGLLEIFDTIRDTENMDDLPAYMRKALEWGRINFAFVLHTQFVTSDRSVTNIGNLKRTHMLIPYTAIRQVLKISNPFFMIKGVLDLFLSQPLGTKSLLQRILMVNMQDQAKELQRQIQDLEASINDPSLCAKIRNATETPRPQDLPTRQSLLQETTALLQNPDIGPALTPDQIRRVAVQDKESQRLILRLGNLWKLYARQQERQLMMGLLQGDVTGGLIKDLIALFYEPLAQVYKAANIGDAVSDTCAFVDDLIKLLDSLDAQNVGNSAPLFVDLVKRHERTFYRFVHDIYKHDTSHVFAEILAYVDRVSTFISGGASTGDDALDMSTLMDAVLAGDADKQEQLKHELDSLHSFYQQRKDWHALRQREKLVASTSTEFDVLDVLPGGPNSGMATVLSDMTELDMLDDEEDSDDEDGTGAPKLPHESTMTPPTLTVLPTLLPLFRDHIFSVLNLAQ
ncbi:hypothetical protein DM01DRAFT_1331961 [Hesseltinella vesiculosa]|uniref:PX domain-containing protein n=1 Tax=Hesseltinella vesiculosa TaxID=101127 RepID=A0A1X2GTK0_9FUNG|nr:hypothetical protein DM01DRAFT_1331961 [Hesseltinella vesiculosa]